MPAPANDNWANAQVVTGASGDTSNSPFNNNISATAESGEPANNGVTVWFAWTAPSMSPPETIFFSTEYSRLSAPLSPDQPLRTVLQVFTGSAVNALTEVSYVSPLGNFNEAYGKWDMGSKVAFTPTSGTTYYIRVDGVSGATGYFQLHWAAFFLPVFDYSGTGCGACTAQYDATIFCVGSPVTLSGYTTPANTVSFGTFSSGQYVVNYCNGAYEVQGGGGTSPAWSTNFTYTPSSWPLFADGIEVLINGTTGVTPGSAANRVRLSQPPSPKIYSTQAAAESASSCMTTGPFLHGGGSINIGGYGYASGLSTGTLWQPMGDGTPDPTFQIYQAIQSFSLLPSGTSAAWTTPGSAATCTIEIQNLNGFAWSGMTATLSASGGISSPSSPLTGQSIAGNGTLSLTFTFNCTTPNVTATLTLSCPYFTSNVVFTVFLGPVVTLSTHSEGSFGSCSPLKFGCSASFLNSGYWDESGTNLDWTLTTSPSATFYIITSACTTVGSGGSINQSTANSFFTSGGLSPGGTLDIEPAIKPTGTAFVDTLTYVLKDAGSGVTIATINYNVNVPA